MSKFLGTLRNATAEEHAQLEQVMGFETVTQSPGRYRNFLVQMMEIWWPLEEALRMSPLEQDEFLQLPNRLRLASLADDLGFFQEAASPLPLQSTRHLHSDTPLSRGAAAGLLYVLEGSRFGGSVILKTLEPLGIHANAGGSFFFGYGAKTPQMWKEFVTWADDHLTEPELIEAGEMAKQTFKTFRSHFSQPSFAQ